MKIYVASSWKNGLQEALVKHLREDGFNVYDFRASEHAFNWGQVDQDWENWYIDEYRKHLSHPLAEDGFASDMAGMTWADVCVLLLPCGRSAHLELGWFVGKGKPTCIFTMEQQIKPELMYKMVDYIAPNYGRLLRWLRDQEK